MLRLMITDRMWLKIAPLLPSERGRKCRPAKDNRLMLEAILWRFRTGSPWRDLPNEFGPWESVYSRFSRWSKYGIWENVFEHIKQDVDEEWYMLDSTVIRAHQHSAGAKKKEKCGNPLEFLITEGQASDCKQAKTLLKDKKNAFVLADKAYDSDDTRQIILDNDSEPVIPPRKNRKKKIKYDKHIYKARHAIENLFSKIKHFRCLATRYDKTKTIYLATVTLACIVIWARL